MKIVLAYNLRTENTEEQAEFLSESDVQRLLKTIRGLGTQLSLLKYQENLRIS
jgi:hypothetical protein